MQVVVVHSPGRGAAVHWSTGFADELARDCEVHGHTVHRLGPTDQRQASLPVHAVAVTTSDISLECELTSVLRARPGAIVVHVGVGARGSPNVLWIADRLGSRAIACLHTDELVCARGNLIDQHGSACAEFADAMRCRQCCTTSWWRRPHLSDLQNRTDLHLASLLVAEQTLVRDAVDLDRLTSLGLPAARIATGLSPAAVIARF